MNKLTLAIIAVAAIANGALGATRPTMATAGADVPALVPMPREIRFGEGECVLDGSPTVRVVKDIPSEGYELSITPKGVEIRHSDEAGLFYAKMTLRQLERRTATPSGDGKRRVEGNAPYQGRDKGGAPATYPCVEIRDSPAFRWRGVHLDDVRHFFGKRTVKRLLEEMSWYKFNVFHWHLTDSQAWLLDIPGYPKLVQRGKGREFGEAIGPFRYTDGDVREILAYAAARHVTVVPEIEFPGHFDAARRAYPDLACPGGGRVMCIGNPESVEFAEKALDRVCELFPSQVIHIGGDECTRKFWKKCPRCRELMKCEGMKDPGELQQWLTRRLSEHLAAKGRRAIGWDEIFEGGAALPKGTMGMAWRPASGDGPAGPGAWTGAAAGGHEIVRAPYSHCYFDYSQGLDGDPFDYYRLGKSVSTLENVYSFDPLAGVDPASRRLVAGAQCCNWSEKTLAISDLEWKLWPRALALAEVLWTYPDPGKRDFAEFSVRAAEHRRRLIGDRVICAPIK